MEFFKKKSQTLILHIKCPLLKRNKESTHLLIRENDRNHWPGRASEKSPGPSYSDKNSVTSLRGEGACLFIPARPHAARPLPHSDPALTVSLTRALQAFVIWLHRPWAWIWGQSGWLYI